MNESRTALELTGLESGVLLSANPLPVRSMPETAAVRTTAALRNRLSVTRARAALYTQRLGAPGTIGVALIVFALGFLHSSWLPLRQSVGDLRTDLAAAQRTNSPGSRQPPGKLTPASRAQRFIERLPTRADLPAVLGAFVSKANASGLELEKGSYEWSVDKKGTIGRYRLMLPVKGSYPSVRQFVDSTLEAVPAAALTAMTLKRDEISDAQVEAELSFVVFVRGAP